MLSPCGLHLLRASDTTWQARSAILTAAGPADSDERSATNLVPYAAVVGPWALPVTVMRNGRIGWTAVESKGR